MTANANRLDIEAAIATLAASQALNRVLAASNFWLSGIWVTSSIVLQIHYWFGCE